MEVDGEAALELTAAEKAPSPLAFNQGLVTSTRDLAAECRDLEGVWWHRNSDR